MKKRSDTADGHPIRIISIFVGLLIAAGLGQDAPTTRPAASGPATATASAAVMPAAPTAPPLVTELRARGYAVLPAPRQVRLEKSSVKVNRSWSLEFSGLKSDDIAVRTLLAALEEHDVAPDAAAGKPDTAGTARPGFKLAVRPGSVATGAEELIDRQAYLLRIAPSGVELVGNSPVGLFYGVQTLAQLLEGDGRGPLVLPVGTIRDWPRFALRFVHWDTKHHQDRPETLRRYLDQMARFKINAVSFEMEDKFEYPTHPQIGAPGAFTTQELQALVDYGLERHIQIVPDVQAPAHLCYVLKHKEFAALRCDNSNYMACMEDPAALKLILDMYQDVCNATKGVDYVHVSTDEVYYAGICERFRKPYNPENRSLTFVEFVNRANEFLAQRGRRIIIWAEYPLLAQHVPLLPATLIDGIIGGDDFVRREAQRGIRQLTYCSMQGEEKLFPNYFPYIERDGQRSPGRLADAYDSVLHGTSGKANPIGTFAAAWDDAGLHNETFWLGWAAMAQNGWTPGAASVEQTTADFMDVYYGRSGADLAGIYRDIQQGARFWEFVWERRPSKVRGDGYGSSGGKRPVGRTDYAMSPPPLPNADDLSFEPAFAKRYQKTLAELPQRVARADTLITALQAALTRVQRNRYNLEVYLSLATLQGAEELMAQAARLAANQPQQAVSLLVHAHTAVGETIEELAETHRQLTAVWEVSQYPRNRTVNGRAFLHVMDDVKDHFADRRKDLSYMTAPEESLNLPQWRDRLGETIKAFAKVKNVAVRGLAGKLLED